MPDNDTRHVAFHGRETVDFDTVAFMVLASILTVVALLSRSVPVLIGAMVLAPTFDPVVAIPFGIINKNPGLVRRGIASSLILFSSAFVICIITTAIAVSIQLVPENQFRGGPDMLTERLSLGWHSIVTALAAGGGGALAQASNRKSTIVGVVIALALVPALAAASIGFLVGPLSGWGGIKLFAMNVGGIIAAGLLVLSLRKGAGEMADERGDGFEE